MAAKHHGRAVKLKIPRVYKETTEHWIPPRVEVRWDDAALTEGWHSVSDIQDRTSSAFHCFTTGYAVMENKESLVIMQSVCPAQGSGTEFLTIPKGMIYEIKQCSPGRKIKTDDSATGKARLGRPLRHRRT